MRVLNFGLRTTQQTTMFVKLPVADSTAVLRIGTTDKFATVAFHGDTARTTLPANDYIVALDSALTPSSSAPFTVTTDVDAIYMTAGAPENKSRADPKVDAAMAVLLLGGPTPNGYAARRTSFNATLSFAFRFLTR